MCRGEAWKQTNKNAKQTPKTNKKIPQTNKKSLLFKYLPYRTLSGISFFLLLLPKPEKFSDSDFKKVKIMKTLALREIQHNYKNVYCKNKEEFWLKWKFVEL